LHDERDNATAAETILAIALGKYKSVGICESGQQRSANYMKRNGEGKSLLRFAVRVLT